METARVKNKYPECHECGGIRQNLTGACKWLDQYRQAQFEDLERVRKKSMENKLKATDHRQPMHSFVHILKAAEAGEKVIMVPSNVHLLFPYFQGHGRKMHRWTLRYCLMLFCVSLCKFKACLICVTLNKRQRDSTSISLVIDWGLLSNDTLNFWTSAARIEQIKPIQNKIKCHDLHDPITSNIRKSAYLHLLCRYIHTSWWL